MAGKCRPTLGPRTTCDGWPMRGSLCWRARMVPTRGPGSGKSLHRELELLVRCGISPAQALAAATAEPARVFGLADRGRVAAGQRADLVLVSGDPLTDITATRAIERIWRAGTACDRRAFVASAAEAEQLDAFDAQVAKVVA